MFLRFALDPALYADTYRVVINGARAANLDQVAVPDFLGLIGHADAMDILGQDELGSPAVTEAVESRGEQRQKLVARQG